MDHITKYLWYKEQYPKLFTPNEMIDLVTDEKIIRKYEEETHNKVGIIVENPYMIIVSDLIKLQEGNYYTYLRTLQTKPYAGVVIIPYYNDKIIFLEQFRHSTRSYEIELPRGGAEASNTIEENVRMEIQEELGAQAQAIAYVGSVLSDTGFMGGLVHIFKCKVQEIGRLQEKEGIKKTILLDREEALHYIKINKIKDCFTISALYKEIL